MKCSPSLPRVCLVVVSIGIHIGIHAALAAADEPAFARYFAEGASSDFFRTRLDFANPAANDPAHVEVIFVGPSGERISVDVTVPPMGHRQLAAETVPGLPTEFAISVTADRAVAVERTMTWAGATAYGSHADPGVAAPARRWYLAEGATAGPFSLFYLLSNPTQSTATVTVTYLLTAPQAPIVKTYDVAPHSRKTIWVDSEDPLLEATDVGARIESDVDIVVERAMYRDTEQPMGAGHSAAAAPGAATSWFLAEGATGPFFDLFVLVANPQDTAAELVVKYLLPQGPPIVKTYTAEPRSRLTLRVDQEDPALANTPVSVKVESRNGQPVVVERAMWWPDGLWYEAHASPGTLTTGTRWAIAGAEVGGSALADTYVLVANTSACDARVDVTLLLESATSDPVEPASTIVRQFDVKATSRFNVDLGYYFPEARNQRLGVLVESTGACPAELVVERSTYTSADGVSWSGGANAHALDASPLLLPQGALILSNEAGPHAIETRRGSGPGTIPVTMTSTASSSVESIARVSIDESTGRLTVTPVHGANGTTTVTVMTEAPGRQMEIVTFSVTVSGVTQAIFSQPTSVGPQLLFPAVADLDNDGWPEFLGTMNDGTGRLEPVDVQARGFTPLDDGYHRDNRLVDVNGDGFLDIITGYYTGVDDERITRLFVNNGNQTWHEDPAFTAMGLKGFVHTIVTADFDNDGDSDLFIPVYTHNDVRERLMLLINDGHGRFTEISDAAGVASRGWPYAYKTEGAQAVDFNGDGWIDIYTASRFFINNGDLTFTDRAAELGLPLRYDEGLKFTDWNNDGLLDLVKHDEWSGPYLYQFDGEQFVERDVFPNTGFTKSYGLNIADLNNDGYEDIVTSGGVSKTTAVLLNAGGKFALNAASTIDGWGNDCLAFGDFNRDGLLDIAKRNLTLTYVLNETPVSASGLVVEVVGDNGERNQHGRVVRVTPLTRPEVTYTRVVDGGSGYIAQSDYPITIATPLPGPYRVVVTFDHGPVEFVMNAGERKRVSRSGEIGNLP